MYELYYSPDSASFAVHWMLIEIDAPYVLHRVDLAARAPRTECAALLLTLADRHPTAQMAPAVGSAERVDYYQWAFYCVNSLLPAFRRWLSGVLSRG
jgi:glutathione S-transferase